ncbi:MAG TPA: hypothetical protein VMU59_14135 [Caulobacteraceae bacterium]|nr:hypothetical protein [Caulobacteraceae bacterium]
MSLSLGGSQQSSSGTSTYTPNPTLDAALNSNLAHAQALTSTPFQPYTGQMVASFTPDQIAAQNAQAGVYDNQTGSAPVGGAINLAQGVGAYTPQTISAPQLAGADLSSYMNPYQQSVIDSTLSDLNRQQAIADAGDQAQATQAGAFGGSRSAVLQNLTDDSYARQQAATLASLNQSNYAQAQSAAQSDLARQMQAAQANQSAGLQGASLNLNAANTLGTLGNTQLTQALQRAGAIGAAGDAQQANQQQALNDAYQQWQLAQQYPITMQGLMNSTLGTFPNNDGTTSTTGNIDRTNETASDNESGSFNSWLNPLISSVLSGL